MLIAAVYVLIFVAAYFAVKTFTAMREARHDFTSLKTVTFGDESAVRPNRAASIISVISIFLIWGAFTGSSITPIHVPGPFLGETEFTYTAENAAGERDDATVRIIVRPVGQDVELPAGDGGGGGFALDDSVAVGGGRSSLIQTGENDVGAEEDGFRVVAINGQPLEPEVGEVDIGDGTVTLSRRGTVRFTPYAGWQMEKIWLPAPEDVWVRLVEIARMVIAVSPLPSIWAIRCSACLRALRLALWLASRLAMRWGSATGSGAGLIRSWNSCARCHPWR